MGNPLRNATATGDPPFHFFYDGESSAAFLPRWIRDENSHRRADGATVTRATWTDPGTGLRVHLETLDYADFPAVDWLLSFENAGNADTPILRDIQALALVLDAPRQEKAPYLLYRTNGAPSNETDFEAWTEDLRPSAGGPEEAVILSAGGGRSSNRDFPFFKVDTAEGAVMVAVGWSGQWAARVWCDEARRLYLEAGLELTHFRLHPGERVRMPRILFFRYEGDPAADTWEANARFRQLLYKHYTAVRDGNKRLPSHYCNTCFTRGGHWLNECNAENQISLIRAYAPFGLEALLTDAGWFEGGWPAGAGNWTPRADAYPEGMAPVARAAKDHGMIYGLWFEFERVVAGTAMHRDHPGWVLKSREGPEQTHLLDLGRPEVREHLLGIVRGFMNLPGFRVYRQDFNMDPLPYWRHTDAPDRQGITEIRYIEGLYEYWDRMAGEWPDSLRIECASGGRRIDLETVMRMHIHQKSDYWFDNEVDQASLWGLSQYLPNNTFMTPINRLDDYSFHSHMAASLCLGWIADAEDFDRERATVLLDRYQQIREYLIGAWYPLTDYSRSVGEWLAVQYHRPDLEAGIVLAFRRAECEEALLPVRLRGLGRGAEMELTDTNTGQTSRMTAEELAQGLSLTVPNRPGSVLMEYRRVN